MKDELVIRMSMFMLDCKDPLELAKFYASLIKWEIVYTNEEYTVLFPPGKKRGTYPCISFQRNSEYKPPIWPDESGSQQQMAHIDFAVNDLEKAVQHAINCGAKIAESQFSEKWKVMFDPSGHPFCLVQMKSIIESNDFSLL